MPKRPIETTRLPHAPPPAAAPPRLDGYPTLDRPWTPAVRLLLGLTVVLLLAAAMLLVLALLAR
jgi:hypothetical protein